MTLRQLVITLLVAAIALAAAVFFRPADESEIAVDDRTEATRMIGRHLAKESPGEKILLISNPFTLEEGRDPSVYAFEKAGVEGLRTGIGQSLEIEAVAYPKLHEEYLRAPATFPIDPFSSTPLSSVMARDSFDLLATEHPDCRLIVSLIGLPITIAEAEVWKEQSDQTFALLLPDLTMLGSIDRVIAAFESGKISCALVHNPDVGSRGDVPYALITRENVSETVSTSPEVFGFRSLGK